VVLFNLIFIWLNYADNNNKGKVSKYSLRYLDWSLFSHLFAFIYFPHSANRNHCVTHR